MKKLVILLLVLSLLAIIGCSDDDDDETTAPPTGDIQASYTDLSPEEAKDLIDSTPDLVILDVSPLYAQGHLPGAINHPYGSGALETAIPSLDKDVPYLVYCHSDSISIAGAQLLLDSGFGTVYRLEGNYAAWVEADYQIDMTPTVDWSADGAIATGEYSAFRRLDNDYEAYWRMDSESIHIGMKAETDGWVSIGFDPSSRMNDADIILGFVEAGAATVIDMISTGPIGPHPPDTDEGGSDDIIEFAGSEDNGITIIEFKRLLITDDAQDKNLSAGPLEIIWAYGSSDNPSQRHAAKGSSEIILGQ